MHCASLIITSLAVLASGQAATTAAGEYQPQGSIREYFLGAWKLVATENKYPDGHTTLFPALGANATGFLLYTPSGHMCAQLMKPGRPAWSDDGNPTPSEASSALDGFTSYCGTFEVLESEHIIVHRPETASSPSWAGSIQKRPYHIVNRDRFFFRGVESETQKDGTKVSVTWTITWERLK